MKTVAQTEKYFKMIEEINYNNEHGGVYAYVQFLAYSRELLNFLRPFQRVEKQLDAIEGISWLFNECLISTFTHRQKAIFENKLSEVKEIFQSIRLALQHSELEKPLTTYPHQQAA